MMLKCKWSVSGKYQLLGNTRCGLAVRVMNVNIPMIKYTLTILYYSMLHNCTQINICLHMTRGVSTSVNSRMNKWQIVLLLGQIVLKQIDSSPTDSTEAIDD